MNVSLWASVFFTWPVGLWWLYLVSLFTCITWCKCMCQCPVSLVQSRSSIRDCWIEIILEEDLKVFEWTQKGFVEDVAFTIGQNGDSAGKNLPNYSFILSILRIGAVASYILNEWILKGGQESGGLSSTWRKGHFRPRHSMDVSRCSSCWRAIIWSECRKVAEVEENASWEHYVGL